MWLTFSNLIESTTEPEYGSSSDNDSSKHHASHSSGEPARRSRKSYSERRSTSKYRSAASRFEVQVVEGVHPVTYELKYKLKGCAPMIPVRILEPPIMGICI